MKKSDTIAVIFVLFFAFIPLVSYSHSTRHHLIDMGKSLVECVGAPFYHTFVQGPKDVKAEYNYEVWEREKPEKRGLLKYKLFGIWRAPGVEAKAIVDGVVESVKSAGNFVKEFLSIFFSD